MSAKIGRWFLFPLLTVFLLAGCGEESSITSTQDESSVSDITSLEASNYQVDESMVPELMLNGHMDEESISPDNYFEGQVASKGQAFWGSYSWLLTPCGNYIGTYSAFASTTGNVADAPDVVGEGKGVTTYSCLWNYLVFPQNGTHSTTLELGQDADYFIWEGYMHNAKAVGYDDSDRQVASIESPGLTGWGWKYLVAPNGQTFSKVVFEVVDPEKYSTLNACTKNNRCRWGSPTYFQIRYTGQTNATPVAVAGPDASVVAGNGATLDGTDSSDPDGDALTFEWSDGSSVIGNTASINVGPFSSVGSHTYTLTVTDPSGATSSDDVTITVTNEDPTADAGTNQVVQAGETVVLDGSGSNDRDGHELTYSWSNGDASASTTVGPFNPGTFTFTLTVDDGYGGTDTDEVTVTVTAIPVAFDIKPEDNKNQVNSKSRGVIPTAILGSADFDVSTVDVSTLAFGPGAAAEAHGQGHVEDVNGDGYDDLVLHFQTQDSGLSKGDTSATLSGATTGGWAFEGSDSVSVK